MTIIKMKSLLFFNLFFILFLKMTSGQCPNHCLCVRDTFTVDRYHYEQHVDCSNRLILTIRETLESLSRETTVLDLRGNHIASIPADTFSSFTNLTVILLDNNLIENIEPHAFRGLRHLRILSLNNNKLRKIRSETFSGVSGVHGICGVEKKAGVSQQSGGGVPAEQCGIYVQGNAISNIEQYAFSWMENLNIFLGNTNGESRGVPLSIEGYAFYGARGIRRLSIGNVAILNLRPRIFTNTDHIESLEISDTSVDHLAAFNLEGLNNVVSITFSRVHIATLKSNAFSGIRFQTSTAVVLNNNDGNEDYDGDVKAMSVSQLTNTSNRGRLSPAAISRDSVVQFVECELDEISADVFRDAQLTRIHIERSRIQTLHENVFRGVFALRSITLSQNSLTTLSSGCLGALRNVDEIVLDRNNVTAIIGGTFSTTSDVTLIRITLAHDLTLEENAFAGVYNVKRIEIRGVGSLIRPMLLVRGDSFKDLVAVGIIHVSDVRLPAIERRDFAGMTRIKEVRISSCGTSSIDRLAFGEQVGSVERLDMSIGNGFLCDCTTTLVLKELSRQISDFSLTCRAPNGTIVKVNNDLLFSKTSCNDSRLTAQVNRTSNVRSSSLMTLSLASVLLVFLMLVFMRMS